MLIFIVIDVPSARFMGNHHGIEMPLGGGIHRISSGSRLRVRPRQGGRGPIRRGSDRQGQTGLRQAARTVEMRESPLTRNIPGPLRSIRQPSAAAFHSVGGAAGCAAAWRDRRRRHPQAQAAGQVEGGQEDAPVWQGGDSAEGVHCGAEDGRVSRTAPRRWVCLFRPEHARAAHQRQNIVKNKLWLINSLADSPC